MNELIYVDGCCYPNPGQGGWAWTNLKQKYDYGKSESFTTHNAMALRASIKAIEANWQYDMNLVIISDSQYLVKGINEWIHNWIKYNWRTSKGMVLNRDSWEKLYELTKSRNIIFNWQSGTQGTVEAKRLSVLGSGATKELIEKCNLKYKK